MISGTVQFVLGFATMVATLGSGRFSYRAVDDWPAVPDGVNLGEVAGVAVDNDDRVYVFNRGDDPMVIFDRDGSFLGSWGSHGYFTRPHGIDIGRDGSVYCTDDGNHAVSKHTPDGELLLELSVVGQKAPFQSGQPFNRCTHTALSPSGEIYVSDGYGNARVHKYAADGTFMFSWGESGVGPGEFNLPHNIACDPEGLVYVADRENHRVQIFNGDGEFQSQWGNVHRPCALHLTSGPDPYVVIGELGPTLPFNMGAPNLGPRLSVFTPQGELISRLQVTPAAGVGEGQFVAPHGITVDSRGDVYVGEVSDTGWPQLFPSEPKPAPLRKIQKLARIASAG